MDKVVFLIGLLSLPPALSAERKAQASTKDVLDVASLFAKGEVGALALKQKSYISGQILSQNKTAVVYSGLREPIFQIVLWGVNREKPERLLMEFDPKKQTLEALNGFNQDWSNHFKAESAKHATLDAFLPATATHLKNYCGRLPPGARCQVLTWTIPSGRVQRADIHLPQGPSVPKAVEFVRASPAHGQLPSRPPASTTKPAR